MTEFLEQIVAVDVGQAHVKQYQGGQRVADFLERRGPIHRYSDFEPARAEKQHQHLGHFVVVFDD